MNEAQLEAIKDNPQVAEMLKVMEEWKKNPPKPIDVGDGWWQVLMPEFFGNVKQYQTIPKDGGFLVCMVELKPPEEGFPNGRFHLSLSHNLSNTDGSPINKPGRIPTWEELKMVRYKFISKDLNMAIMLPPESLYYSFHDTCLHLLEIPVNLALDPSIRGGI